MSYCAHVYKDMGQEICPLCGKSAHSINWAKENKLMKQWLKDNPDAWKEVGWWSI